MSATVFLYNALGTLVGISAGLAIPALAALSAGDAMRQIRRERLQETVNVLNRGLRLARRGVMAICRDGSASHYFQNEYHWSQIQHAFQSVQGIEHAGQGQCVSRAVTAAQRDLRDTSTGVHLGASLHREAQLMAAADVKRLQRSYDEFQGRVAYLECVCASMETDLRFWSRLRSGPLGRFSKSTWESYRKSAHHNIHAS
jgi:hypothetical protein